MIQWKPDIYVLVDLPQKLEKTLRVKQLSQYNLPYLPFPLAVVETLPLGLVLP